MVMGCLDLDLMHLVEATHYETYLTQFTPLDASYSTSHNLMRSGQVKEKYIHNVLE